MLWLHLIRKVDNNGKSMLDVRVPVNKNGEGMIHRWGADLVMAIPFLVFFLFLFLFLLLLVFLFLFFLAIFRFLGLFVFFFLFAA